MRQRKAQCLHLDCMKGSAVLLYTGRFEQGSLRRVHTQVSAHIRIMILLISLQHKLAVTLSPLGEMGWVRKQTAGLHGFSSRESVTADLYQRDIKMIIRMWCCCGLNKLIRTTLTCTERRYCNCTEKAQKIIECVKTFKSDTYWLFHINRAEYIVHGLIVPKCLQHQTPEWDVNDLVSVCKPSD